MNGIRLITKTVAGAAAAALVVAPAHAKDGLSAGSDGITLKAADGNLELTLGGRLHLDAARWDSSVGDDTRADFRRARLELSGRVAKIVTFRVDREFAKKGGWRNLWVGIEPTKGLEVRGGNVIVPFSMEELQSSNRSALMERSLVTTLAPGFSLGGMATFSRKNFTVSGGYFGNALDSEDERSEQRGKGFAGRATFAPILTKRSFAHLGLAYEYRNVDSSDRFGLTAKAGSQLAPSLLRTGTILRVDKLRTIGGEAAFSAGSFLLQGQYAAMRLDRDPFNADLNAWYAQASFVVTGQDYAYSRSTGTVAGVDLPRKGGAIEIAARISGIDLKDTDFPHGKGHSYTAGANYYLGRNVRFMANYAHSRGKEIGLLLSDRKVDVVTGRFQVAF